MKRITVAALALVHAAAVLAVACGGGDGGAEPVGPSGTVGPDSGIAFVARVPGSPSSNVFLVDADTGAVQQLTHSEQYVSWPAWSPDRQRLAFIVWPAPAAGQQGSPTPEDITQRHIVVANADGSGELPIGDSIPLQSYSGGFSWSPNGGHMVYMTAVDPTATPIQSKLRVANTTDGSEVPLAEERLGFLPDWSPDGTKIVFGAYVGQLNDRGKGENELFLIDSDGSNLRQITDRPGMDVSPTWSPDGTRIAWWGQEPQGDSSQTPTSLLFMMDVASGQITKLAEGFDPVWSPDGQHIAFVVEQKPPPGTIQNPPNTDIYAVDVETGEAKQLTQGRAADFLPTWSPGGQRIAFVSQRDNQQGEIYVMNPDGSNVRRLTDNTVTEAMLVWSSR